MQPTLTRTPQGHKRLVKKKAKELKTESKDVKAKKKMTPKHSQTRKGRKKRKRRAEKKKAEAADEAA